MPQKERIRLQDLSAKAFEHPADRAALSALRKIPGFDTALRKFIGLLGEKSLRAIYLSSAVKVNDKQFVRLHGLFLECLEILDIEDRPDLFVSQDPFVNAGAVGSDKPFVVINSATLSLLDDDEMRFILGHELGHILADHVLFKTMLLMLLKISIERFGIPLGGLALWGIITGLLEWDRKSELSADRAGLLCGQDPDLSYRVFMKLAGGSQADQMNLDQFILQAEEYRQGGDVLDSIYKLLNLMGQRHPFHVLRVAELKQWKDSGEYEKILSGQYTRRGQEETTSVREEFIKSAKAYKESYQQSQDPLVQFLKDFGHQAKETTFKVFDKIKEELNKDRNKKDK